MAFDSASLGLPAVSHILPTPRKDEIRADPEMLVRYKVHATARKDMGKIKWLKFCRENRCHTSVNAESRLKYCVRHEVYVLFNRTAGLLCHHRDTC